MAFLNSLGGESQGVVPDDTAVAVIALALHVIQADGVVEDSENQTLEQVIRAYFNFSKGEFEQMLAVARKQEEDAVDLFRFTSRINRALDETQKAEFIGMLWQVVHADDNRNELEDHLVWRIAELIGVSGRDRIASRQAAEGRQSDEKSQ
ncbi:TerB family tellurite resistance protein [Rhizobium sp. KVB221]|uniref:TerB family tellurite resistance protein n=1 Tax=Rhizobium setariae TaxID=2801340 RepID=A0A936YQY3_9HYPH|nr:TerB family tellurite resistance protein [Rhizobium setariae]MBL0374058.1 TerB family tellurite resistance protein [Rhizobium setariae]